MSSRRLLGNFGALLAGRSVSILLSTVTLALMTRHLGPALYGQFTLAIAYTVIVATVADAGISMILPRDLARIEEGRAMTRAAAATVTLSLLLYVVTSTAAMIVALLLFRGNAHTLTLEAIAVLLAVGLLTPFTMVGTALASAVHRQHLIAVAQVASSLCVVAAVSVVIEVDAPRYMLVVAFGLTSLVGGAVLMALPKAARTGFRVDRSAWGATLRESLPMLAVTSINSLYAKVDVILLSALSTSVAVGRYGLAYKMVDAIIAVPGLFILVAQPQMVRAYSRGVGFYRVMSGAMKAMCAVALPMGVILIRFAPGEALVLGGRDFAQSEVVIRVLMVAVTLTFPTAVLSAGLVTMGRQRRLVHTTSIAAATNIGGNLILIPTFGVVGAACALVLSEFCVLVTFAWIYHRSARLPRPEETGPIIASTVGMAVVAIVGPLLFPMRPVAELMVWGVASGVVYTALALLLGVPAAVSSALASDAQTGAAA